MPNPGFGPAAYQPSLRLSTGAPSGAWTESSGRARRSRPIVSIGASTPKAGMDIRVGDPGWHGAAGGRWLRARSMPVRVCRLVMTRMTPTRPSTTEIVRMSRTARGIRVARRGERSLGGVSDTRRARRLVGPCGAGRPLGGPPARVDVTDGWPPGDAAPPRPPRGRLRRAVPRPRPGRRGCRRPRHPYAVRRGPASEGWSALRPAGGRRADVTRVFTVDLHDDRPALSVGELVVDLDVAVLVLVDGVAADLDRVLALLEPLVNAGLADVLAHPHFRIGVGGLGWRREGDQADGSNGGGGADRQQAAHGGHGCGGCCGGHGLPRWLRHRDRKNDSH